MTPTAQQHHCHVTPNLKVACSPEKAALALGQPSGLVPFMSGISSLAMIAALMIAPGSAQAGECQLQSDMSYLCSGPANQGADVSQAIIASGPAIVTTAPDFGMAVSNGPAISITASGDTVFLDENASVITGGSHGVYARTVGPGILRITSNGDLNGTSVGSSGLAAIAQAGVTELSINTNNTNGVAAGISATNNGSGLLSILSSGTASGTGSGGIGINATGGLTGTGVSINSNNASGASVGISSVALAGSNSVVSTGNSTGASLAGLFLHNSSGAGDLVIDAATTTGGVHGIDVSNQSGSGGKTQVTSRALSEGGVSGIRIANGALSSAIDIASNNAIGGIDGIAVESLGTGGVTIDSAGLALGGTGHGIRVLHVGQGAISASSHHATGGMSGIQIVNSGNSSLTITSTGQATGSAYHGIAATNFYNARNLTISSFGAQGAYDGIRARNGGSGSLEIVSTGTAQAGRDAIYTRNSENSLSLTISSSTTSGGRHGINARNYGSGSSEVTSADSHGISGSGIYGINSANGGSLTITSGYSRGVFGISAYNAGRGNLTITSSVDARGMSGDGILATNGTRSEDLSIDAKAASGRLGIFARNFGNGSLSVSTSGTVRGNSFDGLFARNYAGTDMSVQVTNVSGARNGIVAWNQGGGSLVVSSTGRVEGESQSAIIATSERGAGIYIKSQDAVGQTDALVVQNTGGGAITIVAQGEVTGQTGFGFNVQNGLLGTDLSIAAASTVGALGAIATSNLGSGNLSISTSGITSSSSGNAILAVNSGKSISILVGGDVHGGRNGIVASNQGSAGTVIDLNADIRGDTERAVDVTNSADVLRIEQAANLIATGMTDGMRLRSFGGSQHVVTKGDIVGLTGSGLVAIADADASSISLSVTNVSGVRSGILIENTGVGSSTLTLSGTASGGSGAAIDALSDGNEIFINLNKGAQVRAGSSGVAIRAYGGNAILHVTEGASIFGEVRFGSGSDSAVLNGANSLSNITLLDGGVRSSSGANNVNSLTLNGVVETIERGRVINWNTINVRNGSAVQFEGIRVDQFNLQASSGALTDLSAGLLDIRSSQVSLAGDLNLVQSTLIHEASRLVVTGTIIGDIAVSDASLGGDGAINGQVTVNAGGQLLPGLSAGTLALGSLVLNAGSTSVFELGEADVVGGMANDLVRVAGELALNGGTISIVRGAGFGTGRYTLFEFGSLTGALGNMSLDPLGDGFAGSLALGDRTVLLNAASAEELVWWNGALTKPTGGVVGGSGTWSFAANNFTDAGGSVSGPWAGNNSLAVFSGAGGTVTIAAGELLSPSGMSFLADGYVIAGGGEGSGLDLSGPTGIAVSRSVGASINTVITGSGSLTKTGEGTLRLAGENSYTGLTAVLGGTLVNEGVIAGAVTSAASFVNVGTIGGGLHVANGGSASNLAGASILGDANIFAGGAMSNAGTLSAGASVAGILDNSGSILGGVVNNGTLTSSGLIAGRLDNAAGGSARIAGILAGDVANSGTITLIGGTERIGTVVQTATGAIEMADNSTTFGSLAGDGAVLLGAATLTLGGNGADTTFHGVISGSGGLIKTGDGALTLTGVNSFTGPATVRAGGLELTASGSLAGAVENWARFSNAGSVIGSVTNGGVLVSTGTIGGTLVNFASASALIEGSVAVLDNAGTITLTGAVTGIGLMNQAMSGVFDLANFSAEIGTLTGAGSIMLGAGMLTSGGNNSSTVFAGVISGSGGLVKNGSGTLTLTGANSYTGTTTISGGALQIGDGGTTGALGTGNVTNNATLIVNRSDAITFGNAITGTGMLVQDGTGTTRLTGTNSYSGGTLISRGRLAGDSNALQGMIVNNAVLEFAMAYDGRFAGTLAGSGQIEKTGAGILTFVGDGRLFSGPFAVNGGGLRLGGGLDGAVVTLATGTSLTGNGTLGGLVANAGSLVAPGESIGVLRITGDTTFLSGSRFLAEISEAGADLIAVSGTARLAGSLEVVNIGGSGQRFNSIINLVTADGGVSGAFDSVSFAGFSPLFKPTMRTTDTVLSIVLAPNSLATLAGSGLTANQEAVAARFDAAVLSGFDPQEFASIYSLAPAQLADALDQLSGEVHAAIGRAAMRQSRLPREAVLERAAGVSLTGAPQGDSWSAWGKLMRIWGDVASGSGAASQQTNTDGFVVGFDGGTANDSRSLRFGIYGSYLDTRVALDARGSSGRIEQAGGGVYASFSAGGFSLVAGAGAAHFDTVSNRIFALPALSDAPMAASAGDMAQVFGRIGYRFDLDVLELEPFVAGDHAWIALDQVVERGGAAALSVESQGYKVAGATAGLAGKASFGALRLESELAARLEIGDRVPQALLALAAAPGQATSITAARLAGSTFTGRFGAALPIARRIEVRVDYSGEFSSTDTEHAALAGVSVRF